MYAPNFIKHGRYVMIGRNDYDIPAASYRLTYAALPGCTGKAWSLVNEHSGIDIATCYDELVSLANAERMFPIDPNFAKRDRTIIQARLQSPLRPVDGRTADVDGLGLFDAVRSPVML